MTIYQRAILIAGAIAFVAVLFTTPKFIEYEGKRVKFAELKPPAKTGNPSVDRAAALAYAIMSSSSPSRDLSTAAIRGAAVIGAIIMLYFATGKIKHRIRGGSKSVASSSISLSKGYYVIVLILFVIGTIFFAFFPSIYGVRAVAIILWCLMFWLLFFMKSKSDQQ